jgi:tRNA pseudouridine38-40 synthase
VARYFIRISFKGTRFAGWQVQDNAVAVDLLLKQETETIGCGRTDTGVHAKQFYVHFDVVNEIDDLNKFVYSLNAILPDEIVIHEAFSVPETAHVRFDATSRTYEYFISVKKDSFLKELVMFSFSELDLEKMNAACEFLIGKRDYSAFSKSNTQVKTNICDIKFARWEQHDQLLVFTITADRYLRGMVRAIVGTMIGIGIGKMEPKQIIEIIESKNRSSAGMSVPASGLYLSQIKYPYITEVPITKFPI